MIWRSIKETFMDIGICVNKNTTWILTSEELSLWNSVVNRCTEINIGNLYIWMLSMVLSTLPSVWFQTISEQNSCLYMDTVKRILGLTIQSRMYMFYECIYMYSSVE